MKKKSALIFGLVLVILLSFSSGMVWGESKELPRVETACEGKAGVLLAKDEDNFSLIKKCPKGMRLVNLGSKVSESTGSGSVGAGEIAFLVGDMGWVLKKNGEVWLYNDENQTWKQDLENTVPSELVSKIVQWSVTHFLTNDGNVWVLGMDGWVSLGTPGK